MFDKTCCPASEIILGSTFHLESPYECTEIRLSPYLDAKLVSEYRLNAVFYFPKFRLNMDQN